MPFFIASGRRQVPTAKFTLELERLAPQELPPAKLNVTPL
jgi:hypothetical protein